MTQTPGRELATSVELRQTLAGLASLAVLGAHPDRVRPAHYVPAYMASAGCRVVPVNPRFEGEILFGERVRGHLADIAEPVDAVVVFRRNDAIPAHLPELLALRPPPRVVWLQEGLRDDDVATALTHAGIDVVQDRCIMVDHRALVGADGP
ncbi:MAG: CoA-binding protein [Acidimicrobiia bacterium]|nr:CoA-binding protein [Acidimicrobiia bacterium]